MAESKIQKQTIIKSTVKGLTTNNNGNASLGMTLPNIVFAVVSNHNGYKCFPYLYQNEWYITLCDNNSNNFYSMPNINFTATIYYD